MPTTSLPDLPADLHRLIHMEPTREALREFLHPTSPAHIGGARTFTVSNLYGFPYGFPRVTTVIPLYISTSWAQDYRDEMLDVHIPDYDQIARQAEDRLDKTFGVGRDYLSPMMTEFCVPCVQRHGGTFPSTRAESINVEVQMAKNSYERRRREIAEACSHFGVQWLIAFHMVTTAELKKREPHMSVRLEVLQLYPHLSLPNSALIEDMRRNLDLRGLIVLTARHELGYIYLKAREWHQWIQEGQDSLADVTFLNQVDWDRINARIRVVPYIQCTPAKDNDHRLRSDTPVDTPKYPSDLARLYSEMAEWCKSVYESLFKPQTCQVCAKPFWQKQRGRPRCFCPTCSRQVDSKKSTPRQQKHRKNPEPTPYEELRKHAKPSPSHAQRVTINHD